MLRSMRRLLLLLGALSGCDAVFGLDDTGLPKCAVGGGFDDSRMDALRNGVDVFSFDKNRDHGILSIGGVTVEAFGDKGAPTELGVMPMYTMAAVALEPNGKYFFQAASIEPLTIQRIEQKNGKWDFDPHVPKGVIAGTPSDSMADKPVRVVVRLFQNKQEFLEYELAADGNWMPMGQRFDLPSLGGANLTPDGLALVFDGIKDDKRGVYVAQRSTLAEEFRTPVLVFSGAHQFPQLFDGCDTLYSVEEGGTLTRFTK